ncbi:MAG: hypothetical protein IKT08_02195, partial [Bacteroidales bacterium]|nr:hypothetical protein [Bacteroidales bacterium]
NMSYEERKIYEDYRFERHYDENMLKAARYVGREEGREEGWEEGRKEGRKEGREEGRKEGREEGRHEEKMEIVLKMKAAGMDPAVIAELTGFDPPRKD